MAQAHQSEGIALRDLEFRFRSGRLCLDFVATVADRAHLAFDRWQGADDFSRWCEEAGLLVGRIAVNDRQLDAARQARELIHRLVEASLAGHAPRDGDIKALNRLASHAPLVPELKAVGRSPAWTSPTPFQAVISTVARDAIDLLAGDQLHRVRECAGEDCSILFVDTSRPGKRRWCAMNGCGNKVKKANHRKRQSPGG